MVLWQPLIIRRLIAYWWLLDILTLICFETSVATDNAGQVLKSVFVFPNGCSLPSNQVCDLLGGFYRHEIHLFARPTPRRLGVFLSAGAIVLRGFLLQLILSRSWVIARGRVPWLTLHDELAVCYFLLDLFSSWLDNSLVPVVSVGAAAPFLFILILYLWNLLVRVWNPCKFCWVLKEYCVFQYSQWY